MQKIPFGEVHDDEGLDNIYNLHPHYDHLVSLMELVKDDLSEHLIDECNGLIQDMDDFLEIHSLVLKDDELSDDELERLKSILTDLFEEINNILDEVMPYSYYGSATPGCQNIGMWPAIAQLEDGVRDGEVIKVSDLSEIPKGYRGPVMLVNDHGNITYGFVYNVGEFHERWSCV